ncbi:hypothetical protein M8J77_016620 [Diaphorina citri]|nr:hypothetical protein M8J77_016620 [Diaphorina citri]
MNLRVINKLYLNVKRLRNTEQYWKQSRSDIVCMTRHYGPATRFLTLSPSEWMWNDLGDYIKSINGPEMANKSTSELVALDPVAASRFMDYQFKAMLDFITPLGVIEHYAWRREYQGRGAQHWHLMIWVKDAPILEESTAVEVAEFIARYVTCKVPDRVTFPTLYFRVTNYQTHRHNSYCLRKKKTELDVRRRKRRIFRHAERRFGIITGTMFYHDVLSGQCCQRWSRKRSGIRP